MTQKRYAVVSCHVEQPLDDRLWRRFESLQESRPGGFPIAALIRPPDPEGGESAREEAWLERARAAASRAPFGLHTHWTAPDQARPKGGDPAARVVRELAWLKERSLELRLFCGGGWYADAEVAGVLAGAGLIDCTPTRFRPSYLPPEARRLDLGEPSSIALADGRELAAIPSTRSLGMLVRALFRPGALAEPVVHVYFHDTELASARRRLLLRLALVLLARRRVPLDQLQLLERLGPLPQVRLSDCLLPRAAS
jgi:hypothetical protein